MRSIDKTRLSGTFGKIDEYEEYYTLYGRPLVKEAVGDLDDKIRDVKNYLQQCRNLDLEFDSNSLQRIIVDISTCMYYTREKLSKLQLNSEMASATYKNAVNEAYLKKQGQHDAGTKYSVKQLMAFSETDALEEGLVDLIYSRATKEVEAKLDDAENIYKACSKALSATINEARLFNSSERYTA